MKLVRYLSGGKSALGVVENGNVLPLEALGCSFSSMLELIAAGDSALQSIRLASREKVSGLPLAEVELLAPIEQPGKYLAIGMNYAKHLEEADRLGVARVAKQIWFNKQTSCIVGPHDTVEVGATEKLDYEVELGVVIGKRAKNVTEDRAQDHVFGYLVANDVSARDFQFHSPTMTMGKSFDTHGPIGPWIVTADEIPDPHRLDLKCYVNGELRQSSNTRHLIANLWQQIAYLTSAFTLYPGDLIATGTPEGVGISREPPVFLQPGDVVRCEIEGIGAIENRIVA